MSTSEMPDSAEKSTEGAAGAAADAADDTGQSGAAGTNGAPAVMADIAAPETEPWVRLLLEALLGGALEGVDLLPRLLQAGARTAASAGEGQMAVEPHAPTAMQAALGLGEDLSGGVRRSLALARRATAWVPLPRLRRPPVLVEMALTAGEIALDQGRMMVVNRWARHGQREEARARLVARLLASGAFDAVLVELAHHPEVRTLIERQGKDLATSTLEEIRQRAADVDGAVERAAERLLHLSGRE